MTKEEELKIKEIVYMAVQSTKEENSGLIGHLERIMKDEIKVSIETHVNHKIFDLSKIVVDHNKMVDTYIKEDTAWKVRAEPVVKAFENTSWLGALVIKFLKLIGLLGVALGAYLAIKNFLQ